MTNILIQRTKKKKNPRKGMNPKPRKISNNKNPQNKLKIAL